jgi:hypothetical protein
MAEPGRAYSDRLARRGRRVTCCAARPFPRLARSRDSRTAYFRSLVSSSTRQDDLVVALAGPAHGPHAVDHSGLDLDEALALIALHGPPCCALRERRGDGVIGRISKGDANHLRALDPHRAVISWRVSVAAEGHRRRRTKVATNKTGGMFGMLSMFASRSWLQFNPCPS